MALIAATGEVTIGNDRVPWVDVRTSDASGSLSDAPTRSALREFIDVNRGSGLLRLIVVALPQPSDALMLELARDGVHLLTAKLEVPAIEVLDRLRRYVERIRTSRRQDPLPAAHPPDQRSDQMSESERVFGQRPPWFNEQAWARRLQDLQTPWTEQDRSKWDY